MSGSGLGRLAGRQRRLAAAQRAYGALPPAQRAVLILRYVDNLSPAAIASRLGVAEPEVLALLDSARAELVPTPRLSLVRPVAMAAAGAALALTALSPPAPPSSLPSASEPWPSFLAPVVDGDAPRTPSSVAVPVPAMAGDAANWDLSAGNPSDLADPRTPTRPRTGCATVCLPTTPRSGDAVKVGVPQPVSEAVGQQEVVLEQEYVSVCGNLPTPPAGVARCVPGHA